MIISVEGIMGCGKTIFTTELAYRYLKAGWRVIANYHVDGCELLNTIMDIRNFTNCLIILDDNIGFLDSRESQSNIGPTQMLMASRKKDIRLARTFQVKTGDDIRLRQTTNVRFLPYLIEFPLFGVDIYRPDGKYFDNFEITFCREVLDMYDTNEVAHQRISEKEMMELYEDLRDRDLFSDIMNMRFNMKKVVARAVYGFLKKGKFDYIHEIIQRGGYVLIE